MDHFFLNSVWIDFWKIAHLSLKIDGSVKIWSCLIHFFGMTWIFCHGWPFWHHINQDLMNNLNLHFYQHVDPKGHMHGLIFFHPKKIHGHRKSPCPRFIIKKVWNQTCKPCECKGIKVLLKWALSLYHQKGSMDILRSTILWNVNCSWRELWFLSFNWSSVEQQIRRFCYTGHYSGQIMSGLCCLSKETELVFCWIWGHSTFWNGGTGVAQVTLKIQKSAKNDSTSIPFLTIWYVARLILINECLRQPVILTFHLF